MPAPKQYPGSRAGIGYLDATVRRLPVELAPATREAGGEGDPPEQLYEIAASSEYQVERSFLGLITWREVLDHDPGSIQLGRFQSGRAAFLADHNSREQIGVIRSAEVGADRILRTKVKPGTSAKARERFADIDAEVMLNSSIGYIPKRAKLVEEDEERGDLWRITLWEPVELSSVSVPADPTVGVGRDASGMPYFPVEIDDGPARGERAMKRVRGNNGEVLEVGDDDPRPAIREAEPARVLDLDAERTAVRQQEQDRIAHIRQAAAVNGIDSEQTNLWINRGTPALEVFGEILKRKATTGNPSGAGGEEKLRREMPGKDRRRYSIHEAIKKRVAVMEGRGKWDGVEAEIHTELEAAWPAGLKRQGEGILVPLDMRTEEERLADWWAKRTMTTIDATKGVELVTQRYGALIEFLRAKSILAQAGAQIVGGITGPCAFPKQIGGSTVVWVPENPASGVTPADVTFGLTVVQPKTMQGQVPYTRQLLGQAGLDVDNLVQNELAIGHDLTMDKSGVHGRGNNGEPTGVYAAAGVTSYDFQSSLNNFTYANIVPGMIAVIADKNADLGTMGWITTPLVAGKGKTVPEHSTAQMASWLWQGPIREGTMGGYSARASTQISKGMSGSLPTGGSSAGIVFGNWADLWILLIGPMELVVDPYTAADKGIIKVTSYQQADVLIRHGESFAKGINLPSP